MACHERREALDAQPLFVSAALLSLGLLCARAGTIAVSDPLSTSMKNVGGGNPFSAQ